MLSPINKNKLDSTSYNQFQSIMAGFEQQRDNIRRTRSTRIKEGDGTEEEGIKDESRVHTTNNFLFI